MPPQCLPRHSSAITCLMLMLSCTYVRAHTHTSLCESTADYSHQWNSFCMLAGTWLLNSEFNSFEDLTSSLISDINLAYNINNDFIYHNVKLCVLHISKKSTTDSILSSCCRFTWVCHIWSASCLKSQIYLRLISSNGLVT